MHPPRSPRPTALGPTPSASLHATRVQAETLPCLSVLRSRQTYITRAQHLDQGATENRQISNHLKSFLGQSIPVNPKNGLNPHSSGIGTIGIHVSGPPPAARAKTRPPRRGGTGAHDSLRAINRQDYGVGAGGCQATFRGNGAGARGATRRAGWGGRGIDEAAPRAARGQAAFLVAMRLTMRSMVSR
jgi:hypothetical protein